MSTFSEWIARRGSKATLAEALEISHSAVRQWGTLVPADRVVQVERVTGIPREQLRPDLFVRTPTSAVQSQDAAA
jgi:DNA-binding transcriptional regulator YdaS (Cro superfamily)